MESAQLTDKKITNEDLDVVRGFLRQQLKPYLEDMRDFYAMVEFLDMRTGVHPWALRTHASGELGYVVRRTGPKEFISTSVYPFVKPSRIDVGAGHRMNCKIIGLALEEPLVMEEFHIHFREGRICFLTRELEEQEMRRTVMQALVFLSRKEAYALLDGVVLASVKDKAARAFKVFRGEME